MAGSRRANRVIALSAAVVAVLMVGASFAAVPLYRIFCQVTGFAGTTRVAQQSAVDALKQGSRVITVSMIGNVNAKLPWTFAPVTSKVTLRVGQTALAFFRATNNSSEEITGVATFNVTPNKAGPYFNKVACFCFTEQTLKPGETVDMPVSFYVDPEIVKDRNLDEVTDIALSYTFFRAPGKGDGEFVRAVNAGTGAGK